MLFYDEFRTNIHVTYLVRFPFIFQCEMFDQLGTGGSVPQSQWKLHQKRRSNSITMLLLNFMHRSQSNITPPSLPSSDISPVPP